MKILGIDPGLVQTGYGIITINNKFENLSVGLRADDNDDGVINLFDKYGELGWGQSGKK